MEHYDKHQILTDNQHGFRKFRSCETQLISTVETIAKSLDDKKQTDLLVLDFSKAFDCVPHNRLLLKLERSGIRNINSTECNQLEDPGENRKQQLLNWFRDWLCGRTQEVVLDGMSSETCDVSSGVPQGTVLGPLCFLIYINDIGSELSPETSLKLFADDSLLIRTIEDNIDTDSLQADLDSLITWSTTWQMKFHPAKCSVMSITNKKKPITHNYTMLGQPLQHVENTPYLGVHLNKTLHWDHHINHIVAKANKTLGFLRRNFQKCPQHVKEQMYRTLVRPTLEYASTAWDPFQKKIHKTDRRCSAQSSTFRDGMYVN